MAANLLCFLGLRGACVAAEASTRDARRCARTAEGTCQKEDVVADGSCAYVTLAVKGEAADSPLWNVLPMARAFQRYQSRCPFVVVTDVDHFPDGKPVEETLALLGTEVLKAQNVPLPPSLAKTFRYSYWQFAWKKLQIWRLTQYKKIVWLDSDAMVTRNMDAMFQLSSPVMMRDTWMCHMDTKILCSALMLLEPSQETYNGLLAYAASLEKLPQGDQQLIAQYFTQIAKTPPGRFEHLDASFGHCLGMIPGVNNSSIEPKWKFESPWRLPAYVHKSSTANECFTFQVGRQIKYADGVPYNVCHYNPVSNLWREGLCSAVRITDTTTQDIDRYCDDASWYAPFPQGSPRSDKML